MEKKIIQAIKAMWDDQLQLLEQLINQSSHSLDKKGVDDLGAILQKNLKRCDLNLIRHTHKHCGDTIAFASQAYKEGEPFILLLGHMDTVFPRESTFNRYREHGDKAYGPGICDMKGGLVVATSLIHALDRCGLLNEIPLVFLCNGDEEIGSIHSTEIIIKYGQSCLCGLVFECGGLGGEVVTARKGKKSYLLEVSGKAGHSAFTEQNGKASAILELAQKIIHLEALNGQGQGLVVNVGVIRGGTGSNVVPDHATAEIDTRFLTDEDGNDLQARIEEIARQCTIPGTSATCTITKQRYPMVPNSKNDTLFSLCREVAAKLGMTVSGETRSGVSDANTIAQCNKPVIDGLGPIGADDHSEDEWIVKTSINDRCLLATLSVLSLWKKHLRNENHTVV